MGGLEMTPDLNARFEDFKASYLKGDGNPAPMLEGLGAEDRQLLTGRIEDYLDTDPQVEVTVDGLGQPAILEMTDRVAAELDGATGGLSALLTRLRVRREMMFPEVIDALATELDASDEEKAKLEGYYHDIEYGNLPAAGISEAAFEAIARVFQTTGEALRTAARGLGPARASATGPVFTRKVEDGDSAASIESDAARAGEARRSDPPDRIDRLFTGG